MLKAIGQSSGRPTTAADKEATYSVSFRCSPRLIRVSISQRPDKTLLPSGKSMACVNTPGDLAMPVEC